MKKLRNQKGLTMVEMLATVVIVLLFSGLVAVGMKLKESNRWVKKAQTIP